MSQSDEESLTMTFSSMSMNTEHSFYSNSQNGSIFNNLIKVFIVSTISLTILRHKCHMKYLCMKMNNTHQRWSIQTTQFMDCQQEEINQYTLGILITTFRIMLLQCLSKVIAPIKMRSCLVYLNLQEFYFDIEFIVLCAYIIFSLYYYSILLS